MPETQRSEVSPNSPSDSAVPVQFIPTVAGTLTRRQVELFERSRVGDSQRPRQWNREARAASDFIAHSMEYLADSRELPSGRFTGMGMQDADSEAILILMEAKRLIKTSLPFIERRTGLFGIWKGIERRKDRQH